MDEEPLAPVPPARPSKPAPIVPKSKKEWENEMPNISFDYESMLLDVKNEQLKNLVRFPSKAILVKTVEKNHQTQNESVPLVDENGKPMDPFLLFCDKTFSTDYEVIEQPDVVYMKDRLGKYEKEQEIKNKNKLDKSKETVSVSDLPILKYEIDLDTKNDDIVSIKRSNSKPKELRGLFRDPTQISTAALPVEHISTTMNKPSPPPRHGSTDISSSKLSKKKNRLSLRLSSSVDKSDSELVEEQVMTPTAYKGAGEEEIVEPDHIRNELLVPYSKKVDEKNKLDRNMERFSLYKVYDNSDKFSAHTGDPRDPPREIVIKPTHQFLFEPTFLQWDLGDIEPMFCQIALYDIIEDKKISESFHFSFLNDDVKTMYDDARKLAMGVETLPVDHAFTKAKKAIFNISSKNIDHVYILLKIDKILSSDGDSDTLSYKKGSVKESALEKMKKRLIDSTSRLSRWRRPFAWGYCNLSRGIGKDNEIVFDKLFSYKNSKSSDQMILEIIREMNDDPTRLKTIKTVSGTFMGKIKKLSPKEYDSLSNKITPSLIPYKDFENPFDCIKVLQEFPVSPILAPYEEFFNNLFVYPLSLNFSSGKSSHRNLAIKFELRDDDDPSVEPLKLLYSSRSNNEIFVDHDWSTVLYHNRSPSFANEIKMKLPFRMRSQHHILATIYHISCKEPKKNTKSNPETPIAYAIIPLYEASLIKEGEVSVPLQGSLPKRYLTNNEGVKFFDGGKPLFTLELSLQSSVYTSEPNLNRLFRQYIGEPGEKFTKEDDKYFLGAIEGIHKMKGPVTLRFLTVVLNLLLKALVVRSGQPEVQKEIFRGICNFLEKVSSTENLLKDRMLSLLSSYVNLHFHLPENYKSPTHVELVSIWVEILRERPDEFKSMVSWSWFMFGIIFKSMVLHLNQKKNLSSDSDIIMNKAESRKNRFPSFFLGQLSYLIEIIGNDVEVRVETGLTLAKDLTLVVGLFLKDLFQIADRGYVLQLVKNFVLSITGGAGSAGGGTSSSVLMELEFDFLRVIVDSPYFIPLNLPTSIKFDPIDAIDKLTERFSLCGYLLKCVISAQLHNVGSVRTHAIGVLSDLLHSIDEDERYQNPLLKQRISQIFLNWWP